MTTLGMKFTRTDRKAKAPPAIRCSFCGIHSDDVADMIAGPDAYICAVCVAASSAIILDAVAKRAASPDVGPAGVA